MPPSGRGDQQRAGTGEPRESLRGPFRYYERGASLWWIALPLLCALVAVISEVIAGGGVHPWGWLGIAALASVFLAIQVYSARLHLVVALTDEALQNGTQIVQLDDIAEILPGFLPDEGKRHRRAREVDAAPAWTTAPVLGELSGVPRRRYPVGLQLHDGRQLQAWAKNDHALRSALTAHHANHRRDP